MKNLRLVSGPFAANPKLVKFIIVHCSATPRGRDVSAADIRRWHIKRGFRDIGYHFVIRLDGTIEPGRDIGQFGAHCLGKNNCSIGICYVGGLEKVGKKAADTRTPEQKGAMEALLVELLKLFPNAEIRSHRDYAAKACPCFDATSEFRDFRRRMLSLLPAAALPAMAGLVASCRSRTTLDDSATEYTRTECSRTDSAEVFMADHTLDSGSVLLVNPEIFITFPDSTVAKITAERIAATGAATRNRNIAAKSVTADTTAYTTQREKHHTDKSVTPQPGIGGGWLTVAIALAAVTVCAASYLRRRLNKSTL